MHADPFGKFTAPKFADQSADDPSLYAAGRLGPTVRLRPAGTFLPVKSSGSPPAVNNK